MTIKFACRVLALVSLLLMLASCGGGGGSTSARTGSTPCLWGTSTWNSGCTWGS